MNRYLTKYLRELEVISRRKRIQNKEEVLDTLLTKISFFQHERLIHLIVNMFTGLFTLLSFILSIISNHYVYMKK